MDPLLGLADRWFRNTTSEPASRLAPGPGTRLALAALRCRKGGEGVRELLALFLNRLEPVAEDSGGFVNRALGRGARSGEVTAGNRRLAWESASETVQQDSSANADSQQAEIVGQGAVREVGNARAQDGDRLGR